MKKKPTARMVAAVIIGATALLGATAGSAAADPPCYSGEVCTYYQGALVSKNGPMYPGQCHFVSHSFDYVRNLSGIQQTAYSGTNCTGRSVRINAGTGSGVNLFWSIGY
ncbi:hypothetical protein E1263_22365 [Kribbella antibiotica]|uniref:Peptidase inhibitor family I36 n=1 Tax=Kribbella antibiotica TaxID=190195 RepID=A0A4R4ZHY7_9ACTN|nr:hypothetical protein [Kribbella antibiotica]TDD57710.1 hypothetical protein E1263_22365 [Kribbella antibiotica]